MQFLFRLLCSAVGLAAIYIVYIAIFKFGKSAETKIYLCSLYIQIKALYCEK